MKTQPSTLENSLLIVIAHFNHCDCLKYYEQREIRKIIVLQQSQSFVIT